MSRVEPMPLLVLRIDCFEGILNYFQCRSTIILIASGIVFWHVAARIKNNGLDAGS